MKKFLVFLVTILTVSFAAAEGEVKNLKEFEGRFKIESKSGTAPKCVVNLTVDYVVSKSGVVDIALYNTKKRGEQVHLFQDVVELGKTDVNTYKMKLGYYTVYENRQWGWADAIVYDDFKSEKQRTLDGRTVEEVSRSVHAALDPKNDRLYYRAGESTTVYAMFSTEGETTKAKFECVYKRVK